MPPLLDIPQDLEPVQRHLAAGADLVQSRIALHLESDLAPVQRLVKHVEKYRGKMLRPALVFLSALAAQADAEPGSPCSEEPSETSIVIGSVCEMVHLATLVHDDVLDDADTRRRTRTVNALAGNEAAVILGDYLFSAAFNLCAHLDTQHTSRRVAEVGMTLCAGELLQLDHRHDFALDERTYFQIVERKTASLIAAACELGARHAHEGAARSSAPRLERFGGSLGVAFQIQDDLLDIAGDQLVVGKTLGKDLEKGKLTLPIIHHLTVADNLTRGRTLDLLADDDHTALERRQHLRAALRVTDSITYARTVAEQMVERARLALEPLADSSAKRMLLLMADAVVTRTW
ncbi:polyprenyl synthetase family protein [soil metagenome]